MILLIIYIIGFITCPILVVYWDKRFPGSMNLNGQFPAAMAATSIFWFVSIFYMLGCLLEYWHKQK